MPSFFHPQPTDIVSISLFWVGALAFFIVLLRARSKPGAGQRARRDWTSLIGIVIQAVGIGVCGGRAHLAPFSPGEIPRALTVLLTMGATVGLFGWATQTMGRNWAVVAQTRVDHELVTTGPFAFVRNPIYAALALFMVGLAVSSGHEAMLAIGLPIYFIGTMVRIRIEERLLVAQFGAKFDAYRGRVKRLIPGLF